MSSRLALLIGNSDYDDSKLQGLGAPLNDVDALGKILKDPDIGQFDDVKCLVNESRDAISEAIEDLFADRKKDDLILLYFSGHGVLDAYSRLFFALPKTRFERIASTGIAAADVKDWMDRSLCQRQVLILDCCHSGAFDDKARGGLEQRAISERTFVEQGHGRCVLTATDATSYAFDGGERSGSSYQAGLGIFTRYIVEGLSTGDAAPDSETVSAQQIFEFARDRVISEDPRMRPQFWANKSEGALILAHNPNPVSPVPEEIKTHLNSPDHIVRLGAIAELTNAAQQSERARRAAGNLLEARLLQERDYAVRDAISSTLKKWEQETVQGSEVKSLNEARSNIPKDYDKWQRLSGVSFYIVALAYALPFIIPEIAGIYILISIIIGIYFMYVAKYRNQHEMMKCGASFLVVPILFILAVINGFISNEAEFFITHAFIVVLLAVFVGPTAYKFLRELKSKKIPNYTDS